MKKRTFYVGRIPAILAQPRLFIAWKKAMSIVGLVGSLLGSIVGPVQAATPSANQGFYQDAAIAAPTVGQSPLGRTGSRYFSATVERSRSLVPSVKVVGTTATSTTRCPAFVSWEDWGGSRVHAYVDFHPSDLCNGLHVKAAYVRLIRMCGPYYDTGRIYTNTATSTSDTQLYSVSVWIFDSPLWSCVTKTYYGYDYF
jgi:hypothetical protein